MAAVPRHEFSSAMYRHMASAMAEQGKVKREGYYLQCALEAFENPLPAKAGWPYIKNDAFGNRRFDLSRAAQQYSIHTGRWNPRVATHPNGLKTQK